MRRARFQFRLSTLLWAVSLLAIFAGASRIGILGQYEPDLRRTFFSLGLLVLFWIVQYDRKRTD
jgi:hypothetical protein